jgi:hypothetical protein
VPDLGQHTEEILGAERSATGAGNPR